MNHIEDIYKKGLEIKEEFQKIETGPWGPKEFGTELVVQTGHLADMILRQSVKYNSYSIEENNKHLGDEISDILLNTFSIIDTCGLSDADLIEKTQKIISHENYTESWEKTGDLGRVTFQKDPNVSSTSLFENIVSEVNQMFFLTRDQELNKEEILNVAAKITLNSLSLASYMELDLWDYFNRMTLESKIFIEQKNKKINESYPYKVPRTKIVIEESALPLLERPPQIELPNLRTHPFLLLRASGLPYIDEVRDKIKNGGFKIDHERKTDSFELLARYLYPADPKVEESYLWFLLSRKVFPENYNSGYAFVLPPEAMTRYGEIDSLKRKIRADIGPTPFEIQYRGKKIFADLHHIHAPDEKDCRKEFQFLIALSKKIDLGK